MSLAVLFTGQGAQHPAMLPWLGGGSLIAATEARLGVPDWRRALEDPAWAARNRHAQILLTGVALAAWAEIAARLPPPAVVAGYSVGELAAFSAAGVFPADMALDLAVARAEAMDRCAAASPGGLLAVGGLDEAEVLQMIDGSALAVAIRIDRSSLVVGGPREALDDFETRAASHGARCTRLAVSVASHTPAMQGAADAFLAELAHRSLRAPAVPLIANATGDRLHDAAAARAALARQVAATVRWSDCLDSVHARRVTCVLEVGPGRALAAGWNRAHPEVPARSAEDFRSLDALVAWVRARC